MYKRQTRRNRLCQSTVLAKICIPTTPRGLEYIRDQGTLAKCHHGLQSGIKNSREHKHMYTCTDNTVSELE